MKNIIILIMLVSFLSTSIDARVLRENTNTAQNSAVRALVEKFNMINREKEVQGYVQSLWQAAGENEKDFSYYVQNILALGSANTLKNFTDSISLIKDRTRVGLVFVLVGKLNKLDLKNRDYEIESIITDIGLLSESLSRIVRIEGGFEQVLDMAIKVTDHELTRPEDDKVTTAGIYGLLRGLMTQTVDTGWSRCQDIKENFILCMQKITEAVIKSHEENPSEVFEQIQIFLRKARDESGHVVLSDFHESFNRHYGPS